LLDEKLIRYAAPHATIVNSTDWVSTKPKLLERVVIVDRSTSSSQTGVRT
jgi:hypothetical protein